MFREEKILSKACAVMFNFREYFRMAAWLDLSKYRREVYVQMIIF